MAEVPLHLIDPRDQAHQVHLQCIDVRRHVHVVPSQSLDLLLVHTCQFFGGTTPPAHVVMMFSMMVQPLVQLRAVGIDPINKGVPYPSELAELPFQVVMLGIQCGQYHHQ